MVATRFIIWLALFRSHLHSIEIKRDVIDTVERQGFTHCQNITATMLHRDDSSSCQCRDKVATFMSLANLHSRCAMQEDLGCTLSLTQNSKKVYLTYSSLHERKTYPKLDYNCSRIHKILIWNTVLARPQGVLAVKGTWVDITELSRSFFDINNNSEISTEITNWDAWKGHVVMLVFPCEEKCLILKFKGTMTYPLNISAFKEDLAVYIDDINNDDNTIVMIVVIIIIVLVTGLTLLLLYIFRARLPCLNTQFSRGDSSTSSTKPIHSRTQSVITGTDIPVLPVTDPWYQVQQLSNDEHYFQHVDDNDDDCFDIPTLNRAFKKKPAAESLKSSSAASIFSSSVSPITVDMANIPPNNPYKD